MKTIKWSKIKILWDPKKKIIDNLLETRKITPQESGVFFSPWIEQIMDPFLFRDMGKAVNRILEAKEKKERVVVFWDYDVDWVSSTAMLVRFFHEIWIEVSYRIPHRAHDGYWLKKHFFDDLSKNKVTLVVTVDCWTRDAEAIDYAKWYWIDIIITDHHTTPEKLPENVVALINPKDPSCNYPNKDLSWSGVAFKLLHAVSETIFDKKDSEKMIKKYIDFAMLWTVADCMRIVWENRVIAYLWLKWIKNSSSSWLKRLIEWSEPEKLDADIIWFKVWPKLNAAGRMDTPYKALKVLLAWESNLDEAMNEIENLNTKRKLSTERFSKHAKEVVDSRKNVIFYESCEIEHWIIWLIAWRLTEAFNKVSIVLRDEWEKLIASVRSPSYISIVKELEKCSDMFEAFWWHDQAAWFTISKRNLKEFKSKIELLVSEKIKWSDTSKILEIDAEITLKEINAELLGFIEKMRPFGYWNPKPLFFMNNVMFDWIDYLWKDKKHLKMIISSTRIEFKAFNLWEYMDKLKVAEGIWLVFEIERNIWRNKESISLNIKDFVI